MIDTFDGLRAEPAELTTAHLREVREQMEAVLADPAQGPDARKWWEDQVDQVDDELWARGAM